ncbi:MAG TPA: hypothetical protein VN345_07545 [Blastocatellia bacterium]|nr:hypothetical protein [Blastocatellia bacterium]
MKKSAVEGLQAVVGARKAKRSAGCEGQCAGVGTAHKLVKGKCPDECDDEILGKLKKEAKKKAKDNADKQCADRAKDCECGGQYQIIDEGCEAQKVEECGEICIYFVSVLYSGECKKKTA